MASRFFRDRFFFPFFFFSGEKFGGIRGKTRNLIFRIGGIDRFEIVPLRTNSSIELISSGKEFLDIVSRGSKIIIVVDF